MDEYDSFMTPKEIRYTLLTMLLNIKPSNTKASTIIGLMNEYYDAIIEKDGEVVPFKIVFSNEAE